MTPEDFEFLSLRSSASILRAGFVFWAVEVEVSDAFANVFPRIINQTSRFSSKTLKHTIHTSNLFPGSTFILVQTHGGRNKIKYVMFCDGEFR